MKFHALTEPSRVETVVCLSQQKPDEYARSDYTNSLKGAYAKAKANAVQGLGGMLEIATNASHNENKKDKHSIDAANGWYRYVSRFALPIYGVDGEIERYNIYHVYMIIRHDLDGRKYLYDVINMKEKDLNYCLSKIYNRRCKKKEGA